MSNITYQIPSGFTGTTNTSDLASQYGKGNSFKVEGNQEDNSVYAFIIDDNRVDSFLDTAETTSFPRSHIILPMPLHCLTAEKERTTFIL